LNDKKGLDPETLLDLVYTWTESWRPSITREIATSWIIMDCGLSPNNTATNVCGLSPLMFHVSFGFLSL
jgi:hypothetical protein